MDNTFRKQLNRQRLVVLGMVFAILFSLSSLFVKATSALPGNNPLDNEFYFDGTYDWEKDLDPKTSSDDFITYSDLRNIHCKLNTDVSACELAVGTKEIRFDTAEELYRYSVDVSFEQVYQSSDPLENFPLSEAKKEFLLGLHYVLGSNIDYSVLGGAKRFIPIGYSFNDHLENEYTNPFTGSFDGQGFVISNLYVADYDLLVYEDHIDEFTIVDQALSPYYTMFTTNEGTIKNVGLVNPTLELLGLHPDITNVSNLVGLNSGTVDHVFVIDNRDVNNAGIRYQVGSFSADFQAVGVVHTNALGASFTHSYYVSPVVMNVAYINKFDPEPLVYHQLGTSANLVYDDTVYQEVVSVGGGGTYTVPSVDPTYQTAELTATLKSSDSSLNQTTNHWFFYPADGYPLSIGLVYDETESAYLISTPKEFAFFSRLLAYTSINEDTNGLAYNYSDYLITNDIDMGSLASGAYKTPSVTFYGSLSGENPEGVDLADNFYIHHLTFTQGTIRSSLFYSGLFSVLGAGSKVSQLNIANASISLVGTESYYSWTFYAGILAGRMTGGTIEDVLTDAQIHLGTEAIGETHVGGLVGQATGVIQRVSVSGTINAGNHTFQSSYSIRPNFRIGGIIGSTGTAQLKIFDSVNHATLTGFSTSTPFSLATGSTLIDVKMGGAIGYIHNTLTAIHQLVGVANKGNLYVGSVINTTSLPSQQRIGGVFGELDGNAPVLEIIDGVDHIVQFANLFNEGLIDAEYKANSSQIVAAGIGVSNSSEAIEFALLFNEGGFDYDTSVFDSSGGISEVGKGTELFFSEYIEGSGTYDKALEIYNPTSSTINLSGYSIQYFSGANTNATSTYSLAGSIAPGDVYVIAHSSASTTIRNVADATTTGIMAFSGDDSLALRNGTTVIDSIGQRGYDPGTAYTSSGISTINMTLVRKPSIVSGRTDYSGKFDPSSEWIGYANGTYTLIGSHSIEHQRIFKYTSTIFDIGNQPVTLSRVYNYANLTFDSSYYLEVSPLYRSLANNPTIIRFSSNYGEINYMKNAGSDSITLKSNLLISGITTATNVSYLNVNNYGSINVANLFLDQHTLSVAGITHTLSEGYNLKNSLNQGTIKVGAIDSASMGAPNIFIGGLVNLNASGDLHDIGQDPNYPVATEGIIDSMNYGDISTTYSSSYVGVLNRSNTFAAGIATLNAGSIQDTANLGLVSIYNSATNSGTTSFATDSSTAGRVLSYGYGVTAGGIVAVVLNGNSRVYDIANNGDIISVANLYARSGGVIATALYSEGGAGGLSGMTDDIGSSIIKNGLNFGNVTAITSAKGAYSPTEYNTSITSLRYGTAAPDAGTTGCGVYPNTTVGSNDRPGVYAAAGGVVGYGLSVMKNMLNHGTISGTDVAGGIVGATYVQGTGTGTVTTVIDINTAINYGEIKAISTDSYSTIVANPLLISNISASYLADENDTIFPTIMDVFFPGTKRGFGGIFGRLQRGVRGIMSTDEGSFDFIVNMNEKVDLIGRLDQDYAFSNSARYFQFYDAIYYSARWNDTTQAVFTGFTYGQLTITNKVGTTAPYTYTATITNIFEQIGSVATLISSPNTTGYQFTSSTNLSVGNTTLRFLDRLEVPWITEDALDPNLTDPDTQHVYDEDFEMRINEDLTKFIYYMEFDLLASQFKVPGSYYRPGGMYVLSTSAGSTYGKVLPTNIDTIKMRPINEEHVGHISLLIDYSSVSTDYTLALPIPVQTKYNALKQTIFNDKAELVPSESILLTLEETTSSHTLLVGGNIDYSLRTIEFTISMEAFLAGGVTASYEVTNALISANALIAKRAEDYFGYPPEKTDLETYRDLLYDEGATFVSELYAPLLTLTLPAKEIYPDNVTLPLGYFSVYSEAFVGSNPFATSSYYRDYSVSVTFTPGIAYSSGYTGLTDAAFNGGNLIDVSSTPTDIRGSGTVDASGSLRLVFTDENDIFLSKYDFKNYFALKFYDSATSSYVLVPASHYTVLSVPTIVGETESTYEITFTFLGTTSQGDYRLEYRYFPTSTLLTLEFDKNPSGVALIEDFTYYSEQNSVSIDGLTINSAINLGATLYIDYDPDNFTPHEQTGLDPFLSNMTYDVSFMTSGSFTISPFAALSSARLVEVTFADGYKDYEIEYVVTAEDGTTTSTYTHHIIERTVDLVSVLKNGNETDLNDVFASREDQSTLFTVDLGFDQTLNLYNLTPGSNSYLVVETSATELDGITPFDPEDIVGLVYSVDDYLMIAMDYDTIPGIYTFTFEFFRDGTSNFVTLETDLVITKLQGVSPYLTDIRFSLLANETSYPSIVTLDDNPTFDYTLVTINPAYNPAVYFAGIDYAGADVAGIEYYWVDGKVSKVPLEQYVPYMVDYLPYGGTIARYDYNDMTSQWEWTDEVGENASSSEIALLVTNYTEFPDTHFEPDEDETVMILYRVTSEDGNHFAYYYISVTDVEFNTSMIFDLYYCTTEDEGSCALAKSTGSGFTDQMVIVTVKNYITDGDDTVLSVLDPENYPEFSEIISLKSKMTQFIYTHPDTFSYGFGRNRSGFFTFELELPLDPYLNQQYSYEIKYDEYSLNDASDYVDGLEGKYFYIGPSTKNRSRRFNVYIRSVEASTDKPWGLFDFFRSWGD